MSLKQLLGKKRFCLIYNDDDIPLVKLQPINLSNEQVNVSNAIRMMQINVGRYPPVIRSSCKHYDQPGLADAQQMLLSSFFKRFFYFIRVPQNNFRHLSKQ